MTGPTFLMNGEIMEVSEKNIEELFTAFLKEENLELYDLNIVNYPLISKIEVYVYSSNSLDYLTIERLSHQFQSILQDFNIEKGSYELIVSTPGIERKLKTKRHFELALGELITVKTTNDICGQYVFIGVLKNVGQKSLNLLTINETNIDIEIDNIKNGKVKYKKFEKEMIK